MKKIKPKKIKQQKVVKVTPVRRTNIMKGSTKVPDIPVSEIKHTGKIKINTKAPKTPTVSIKSGGTPPISIPTPPKTPSQGYIKKPKQEKEVKEKVVKEKTSSVEKRRQSVISLIDNKEKAGHIIPDDIKQKVATSNSVTELKDISKYIRETYVKKRKLTPEEKLEKKRQDLFTMVQKRKQAGIVLPNDIMDKIDSADIDELSNISKELQSKYKVRTSEKNKKELSKKNTEENIRNQVRDNIELLEHIGVKVPDSIKSDVFPINADYNRVKEVYKILGGNLRSKEISLDKSLFIKLNELNKMYRELNIPEVELTGSNISESDILKALDRKKNPEYKDIITGKKSTQITSPETFNRVIKDIISENPQIARIQKSGEEGNISDVLTELYMPENGVWKSIPYTDEMYHRLSRNATVAYQLSDEYIGSQLDKVFFKGEKGSIDEQSKFDYIMKDKLKEFRKEIDSKIKTERPDLTYAERQKLVSEEYQKKKQSFLEKRESFRDKMVDYVQEKMSALLSKIQDINGNIDPHRSLKSEINKVVYGMRIIDDTEINNVVKKLKLRFGFNDDESKIIFDEISNKLKGSAMTQEDILNEGQKIALQSIGIPDTRGKVEKILIDVFVDKDKIQEWTGKQIEAYYNVSNIYISTFLNSVDNSLRNHPSYEQAKYALYNALELAISNVVNNNLLTNDEIKDIIKYHEPHDEDQLYLPVRATRWIMSLFNSLKYYGAEVNEVIELYNASTGWTSQDFAIAYATGVLKSNTSTAKQRKYSKWGK